ncbi:MAG: glycosyltransferase [Bacteroidota bacterium]
MKVAFLSTAHDIFDDRIFYHMANTLVKNGMKVMITCSNENYHDFVQDIYINSFLGNHYSKTEKINAFFSRLSDFSPMVIVCSTPLSILAAFKYKKNKHKSVNIIYDITEWYPSKKNINVKPLPVKALRFFQLLLFHFSTIFFCNGFIFGEWYKSRPFRYLFPRKPHVFISYYPDLSIIPITSPGLHPNKLRLCYSGKLTHEKGMGNFISVLEHLNQMHPELVLDVKIIGWYSNETERYIFEKRLKTLTNTSLSFFPKLPFHDYLNAIKDIDIFFDLRSDDFENQHCLPIKLFYYAALGRPVIFTNLKAIRKEVEIELFGFLTSPSDHENIALIVDKYLKNPKLYYHHCENARKLSVEKYNWKQLEDDFICFLQKGHKKRYAE